MLDRFAARPASSDIDHVGIAGLSSCQQSLPIETKGNDGDCLTLESYGTAAATSGTHVPQASSLVKAGAGQKRAVRAERHRPDNAVMLQGRKYTFARFDVPKARRAIVASGCQECAIRTENNAVDFAIVSEGWTVAGARARLPSWAVLS